MCRMRSHLTVFLALVGFMFILVAGCKKGRSEAVMWVIDGNSAIGNYRGAGLFSLDQMKPLPSNEADAFLKTVRGSAEKAQDLLGSGAVVFVEPNDPEITLMGGTILERAEIGDDDRIPSPKINVGTKFTVTARCGQYSVEIVEYLGRANRDHARMTLKIAEQSRGTGQR